MRTQEFGEVKAFKKCFTHLTDSFSGALKLGMDDQIVQFFTWQIIGSYLNFQWESLGDEDLAGAPPRWHYRIEEFEARRFFGDAELRCPKFEKHTGNFVLFHCFNFRRIASSWVGGLFFSRPTTRFLESFCE